MRLRGSVCLSVLRPLFRDGPAFAVFKERYLISRGSLVQTNRFYRCRRNSPALGLFTVIGKNAPKTYCRILRAGSIRLASIVIFYSFLSGVIGLLLGAASDTFAARFLIVTIGDSITAGYPYYPRIEGNGCAPPCGGYQPMLQNLLRTAGKDVLVRNYGVRGAISADGAGRIEDILDSSNPTFVLIMEGTNDLLFLSAETVRKNLAYMVDAAIARGEIPVLGTIPPDIHNSTRNIGKPIAKANALIRQLANERNVALADHYDALISNWHELTWDGLHPNGKGYEVMARTWFKPLNERISAMTSLPWLLLLLDS